MKKKIKKIILLVIKIMVVCFFIYPLILIFSNSFKPYDAIITDFLSLPKKISFEIYIETWNIMNFNRLFMNSIIYTVIVVFFVVFISSMAGYMLARTKSIYSKIISTIIIIPFMVPFQSYMITLTTHIKAIGLSSSRIGYMIVMAGFFVPLATLLARQFTNNIPMHVEECASIDGACKFNIFFRIILPLLNPAIVTIIVVDVIAIWNDFIIQLLILGGKKDLYSIPNALYSKFSNQTSDWEHALPGLVISMIPMFGFFIFMQKQIVNGIAIGAVKG